MQINFNHFSITQLCILIYNTRNDLRKNLLIYTKILEVKGRSDLGEKKISSTFLFDMQMRFKMVLCFVKILLYCAIALRGTDSFLHPQRILCWKLAQDAIRRVCSPAWFWQVICQIQDFGRDRVGLWNWEWRRLGKCTYCMEASNVPLFFGQGKIAFPSLESI